LGESLFYKKGFPPRAFFGPSAYACQENFWIVTTTLCCI